MLSLGRTLFHDEMGVPSSDMKSSQSRVVVDQLDCRLTKSRNVLLIVARRDHKVANWRLPQLLWDLAIQHLRRAQYSTEQPWHGGSQLLRRH